jgi:hypothetical protein
VDLTSTAADWFLCVKDTIESRIIGALATIFLCEMDRNKIFMALGAG